MDNRKQQDHNYLDHKETFDKKSINIGNIKKITKEWVKLYNI